jgi:hypothetical protein
LGGALRGRLPPPPPPRTHTTPTLPQATSALTYNIVGHTKTILILAMGVIVFGDSIRCVATRRNLQKASLCCSSHPRFHRAPMPPPPLAIVPNPTRANLTPSTLPPSIINTRHTSLRPLTHIRSPPRPPTNSPKKLFGISVALCGVIWYSKIQLDGQAAAKAQAASQAVKAPPAPSPSKTPGK